MEDLVSVLISTYNRRDLVEVAVRSCLDQTYGNVEVVVWDDGSTDGTREWGESLSDHRIHYEFRSHRGPSFLADITREMLDCANGRYIALLDSDDYYVDSDSVASLVDAIKAFDCAMVFGSLQPIDESGALLPAAGPYSLEWHRRMDFNSWSKSTFIKHLLKVNFIPCNATLMLRDAVVSAKGFATFAGFPAPDYQTWLALAVRHDIKHLQRVVTAWRHHSGQVTSSRGLQLAEGSPSVIRHYFRQAVAVGLVEENDWPEISRAYRTSLARNYWAQVSQMATKRNWKDMRRAAMKQYAFGDVPLKLEAVFAYASGLLHWDLINPALDLASRHDWRLNS